MGRLGDAWARVRANAQSPTASPETRRDVWEFEQAARTHLKRIQDQLRERTFRFDPQQGIPVAKKSGGHRPIVVASVQNRIVQRAIHDTLVDHEGMEPFLLQSNVFGTTRGRGIREAIEMAHSAMVAGAEHYIRSDIVAFYDNIPRSFSLKILEPVLKEAEFLGLLDDATRAELQNAPGLERRGLLGLFPDGETGVAQGCALSPLLGNVVLSEFDQSGAPGVVRLRYADDLLFLATDQQELQAEFSRARDLLGKVGLRAYAPGEGADKAVAGRVRDGIAFLGCDVRRETISPSKDARQRLLLRVRGVLSESDAAMSDPSTVRGRRGAFVETLYKVDFIVKGWGNQYAFCNNANAMNSLQERVWKEVAKYFGSSLHRFRRRSEADGMRLLGVHVLQDSKRDPIIGSRSR